MTTLAPSLSESGRAEILRLLHGPCDPAALSALTALRKALADGDPGPVHGPGRGAALMGRLRSLADALPPGDGILDDPARLAAVHAHAAVADPSLCLAGLVHHLLCLGSLTELSVDQAGLEPRLSALREGRAKGVYLITEVGQANSHLDTGTRADFDPADGSFVLHTPGPGAAKFGSAGTRGVEQTGVVLARLFVDGTDRGVFAFMVGLTDAQGPLPGVELSDPIALDALPLDYVQVRFHRVRVTAAHWLSDGARIDRHRGGNQSGDSTVAFHDPAGSPEQRLQRTLRVGQGLWGAMPAVAAATSRRTAVQAVHYARTRRTQSRIAPGVPLLAYRSQQTVVLGALADAFALTCAADGALAVRTGARAPVPPGQEREDAMGFTPWAAVSRPLAAYKAVTVRTAARLTAECQHRCGFSGQLTANRLAGYRDFHHAFETAGGDSQLIFYDIGRSLVEEGHGREPELREPLEPTSPYWWPALLRRHRASLVRELIWLGAADASRDPFERWNPLLERAGVLGEAHATLLMADDVVRVLDGLRDPGLVRALTPLAALHGALSARRWAGSLLALGPLEAAEFAALSAAVDRLCDAVMEQLPLLLEVFGEPGESPALGAMLDRARGAAS
ncbi:acyl-CoA dehydrogenase family protein [Streptomyces cavourensis]|uniref:acyl-CoA dehydrogenase family protein n=1 Tax=Streptomyces cavourensis TaxID=67258 RepID=UPI000DC64DEB|nr:acyl-CoA oxidase [Streptomyces cavourensis]ATY95824.1 acyl-CoA oxidase [Streptomyces cavourensis]